MTRGPVHTTLSVERGSAVLTLEIEKGWHVQSHRPTGGNLATNVTFSGARFGALAYPEGRMEKAGGETLSVYSGKVEIRAPIERTAGGPIRATVEFQPCDEKRCLAPERVELEAASR